MLLRGIDLDSFKLVDALASAPTITAASEKLFLTPSAVSQRLSKLEDQLGIWLVQRGHRGIKLTGAGEIVAAEIKRALIGLDSAVADARQLDLGIEKTRISVPVTFAKHWLFPRLPKLYEELGHECFEFVCADSVSHSQQSVDVAIDYVSEVGTKDATVLFRDRILPVAVADYFEAKDIPLRFDDPVHLERSTLLMSETCLLNWQYWLKAWRAEHILQKAESIYFGNCLLSLDAASSGIGFGMTSFVYLEHLQKRCDMISPTFGAVELPSGWIIEHKKRSAATKAKATQFVDWARSEAENTLDRSGDRLMKRKLSHAKDAIDQVEA